MVPLIGGLHVSEVPVCSQYPNGSGCGLCVAFNWHKFLLSRDGALQNGSCLDGVTYDNDLRPIRGRVRSLLQGLIAEVAARPSGDVRMDVMDMIHAYTAEDAM